MWTCESKSRDGVRIIGYTLMDEGGNRKYVKPQELKNAMFNGSFQEKLTTFYTQSKYRGNCIVASVFLCLDRFLYLLQKFEKLFLFLEDNQNA